MSRSNDSPRQENGDPDLSEWPQHVVVSGATSGIGRALALYYAKPGRGLSLIGRDRDRMAAIVEQTTKLGAHAEPLLADVRDAEILSSWLLERDEGLPVDLLITSAGIGGTEAVAPSTGEDGELARKILSINTLGVINCVTPLLPSMCARRRGHIAIVGSISGLIGLPQSPVYCASKAAIEIYGDSLRRLLRQHGVNVTTVLPGFVDTPMSRSLDMPRPFCWPADKAAAHIARNIRRGARRYAFPWPLRFAIATGQYAPAAVADLVLQLTTKSGWANR